MVATSRCRSHPKHRPASRDQPPRPLVRQVRPPTLAPRAQGQPCAHTMWRQPVRTSRLHAAADVATRVVAVLTVAGLAGLAGTISYQHMVLLARRNGVSGIDAHAFPICVDGLDLILGVLVLLADRRTQRPSGQLP